MTPTLNWKEAEALARVVGPEIQGLFVDRVVVPERPDFPEGHLRHEWVIRLSGRRSEASLFFSIRPRHPYLALSLRKSPKAAPEATHSPFSLALSKQLKGAKILGLEALPQERILVLWLTADGAQSGRERLGLVLCLIPAVPEALLVRTRPEIAVQDGWPILARSRTLSAKAGAAVGAIDTHLLFSPPTGSQAPASPVVREELFAYPEGFFERIQSGLKEEAFEIRLRAAERDLKDRIKQARERVRQSDTALKEAEKEADWKRYGELLKATLYALPPVDDQGKRALEDYNTGESVLVPCDPRLEPSAQVEKFFQLARRKARRIEEARLRIETFSENLRRWDSALERCAELARAMTGAPPPKAGEARPDAGAGQGTGAAPTKANETRAKANGARNKAGANTEAEATADARRDSAGGEKRGVAATGPKMTGNDWAELEKLERVAGILPQTRAARPEHRAPGKGKASSWLGKSFISKDGLMIMVGRSKDENLELTFKHARGNDVWLHVRGRPGAHVLVPLSGGKSAPLETLLDAAALAIYYSGGEQWGKTEVDYTFKKYVKRIKDSSEASYTHNKTLILTADAVRIKRLQASNEG